MLTEIIKVNPKNPERKIIKLAADIMRRGEIVAFPTETVYGLGADPFNARAVRKLFRAKNRRADKPVSILVCNDSDVKRIAVTIPKSARVLIDEFFPGALTVILKKKKEFSDILTGGKNTIGIRMPDSKIARALIKGKSELREKLKAMPAVRRRIIFCLIALSIFAITSNFVQINTIVLFWTK